MKAKQRRCPRCRRRVRVKKSGGLWLHFARPGISFGYCEGSGLLIALTKRQRAIDREMKREIDRMKHQHPFTTKEKQ